MEFGWTAGLSAEFLAPARVNETACAEAQAVVDLIAERRS
jgi:hypothetical protein